MGGRSRRVQLIVLHVVDFKARRTWACIEMKRYISLISPLPPVRPHVSHVAGVSVEQVDIYPRHGANNDL